MSGVVVFPELVVEVVRIVVAVVEVLRGGKGGSSGKFCGGTAGNGCPGNLFFQSSSKVCCIE